MASIRKNLNIYTLFIHEMHYFILILHRFYEKILFFHFNEYPMSYTSLEELIPLHSEKKCPNNTETAIISEYSSQSSLYISTLTPSVDNFVCSDSDEDTNSFESENFLSPEEDEFFIRYLFKKKEETSIHSYQSDSFFSSTKVNPPESEKNDAKEKEKEIEIEESTSCCPGMTLFRWW